jgi:hypothetical protein
MTNFRIPEQLLTMVAERRLIPFVGAGFSSVHGFPGWDELLEAVAEEVQDRHDVVPNLPYEEIKSSCEGDNLRIAEYLLLLAGGRIGPVRYAISNRLRSDRAPIESTAHVELINLGAAQVYTTNFDDLIEETYRALDQHADVVSLPRDVARSHADRTQIVKYHGDLRHDETLVLTESQYYKRLDFESPMDLKFRSDLLGRSVLFIGYSFGDVNIRVVWFKLMQMMQDVPAQDRLPSYIVRLRADPVLDRLYEEVGLRCVVIDPEGEASNREDRDALLAEFMLELSLQACAHVGGVSASEQFVSHGLLNALRAELEASFGDDSPYRPESFVYRSPRFSPRFVSTRFTMLMEHLATRQIPAAMSEPVKALFDMIADRTVVMNSVMNIRMAVRIARDLDGSAGATLTIARALLREQGREILIGLEVPWETVWRQRLSEEQIRVLLELIRDEVRGHQRESPYRDSDIAFGVDLLHRISRARIAADNDPQRREAREMILEVSKLYPSAKMYPPDPGGAPEPIKIIAEIDARLQRDTDERETEEGLDETAPPV